jgi:hypothetical protein
MDSLTLTDNGHLAAGCDVDRVVRRGTERDLMVLRETYFHRRLCADMLARAQEDDRELWEPGLAAVAEVTPLQALEAAHRLSELLTGGRWYLMRDAREAGASWSEIGASLAMSKQGALDWYSRKIADQERHLPNHHDADRARAALEDDPAADRKDYMR